METFMLRTLKSKICCIAAKSKNTIFRLQTLSTIAPKTSDDELSQDEKFSHTPVMLKEVTEALCPQNNGVCLDMTFGAGGHSRHLLNTASIKLYCLDRDPVAYEKAKSLAANSKSEIVPLLGRFSESMALLEEAGVKKNSIDCVLIDAGCSSMQMDDPERGFSISKNGLLDMRMDGNRYPNQPTAADVLNNLDVPNLAKIFKVYGEEKQAKKIAQALFDARYLLKSIRTTHELADLVASIVGTDHRLDKLQRRSHIATKVFQALRIFVNNELNELHYAIDVAYSYLKPGGRLAALAFHSLEDRVVKRHMMGIDVNEAVSRSISQKYRNAATWHNIEEVEKVYAKKWTPLYKSVVTPTEEEIRSNPRCRSAKLRAAIKNFESDAK